DHDLRPDLWRTLDAHSRTLDCGGRGRTFRYRDLVRCKGHASERSREITLSSSRVRGGKPGRLLPYPFRGCNIVTSCPAQANSCSLMLLVRHEFKAHRF